MSTGQMETQKISSFLETLRPPVHVIILDGDLSELNEPDSKTMVETSETTVPRYASDLSPHLTRQQATLQDWVINRVERKVISEPAYLLEMEEKVHEKGGPAKTICAYPLTQVIELDERLFSEILSMHDYIIFSQFSNGQRLLRESVEEALEGALGRGGSEVIYTFIGYMGIERGRIPLKLRQLRSVLRRVLGLGADVVERHIFRRLYLKLRSNPKLICQDG